MHAPAKFGRGASVPAYRIQTAIRVPDFSSRDGTSRLRPVPSRVLVTSCMGLYQDGSHGGVIRISVYLSIHYMNEARLNKPHTSVKFMWVMDQGTRLV